MGSVTEDARKNEPADEEGAEQVGSEAEDREERAERSSVAEPERREPVAVKSGFFRIYKPGQGYWTRLGTAIGAGLLVLLLGSFLWRVLATRTPLDTYTVNDTVMATNFPTWKVVIVGTFALGSLLLVWWYLNSPKVVDFLIATESEMKKVNWTSRKDLIGSTKVVILFMLLIAAALFVIDVGFGYLFHFMRVLRTGPFG